MKWFCNKPSNASTTTTSESTVTPPKTNRAYLLRLKKSGKRNDGNDLNACDLEKRMETNKPERLLGKIVPISQPSHLKKTDDGSSLSNRERNADANGTYKVKQSKIGKRKLPKIKPRSEEKSPPQIKINANGLENQKSEEKSSAPIKINANVLENQRSQLKATKSRSVVDGKKLPKGNSETLSKDEVTNSNNEEYSGINDTRGLGQKSSVDRNKTVANRIIQPIRKLPVPQKKIYNNDRLSTFIITPRDKQDHNIIIRTPGKKRYLPQTPSEINDNLKKKESLHAMQRELITAQRSNKIQKGELIEKVMNNKMSKDKTSLQEEEQRLIKDAKKMEEIKCFSTEEKRSTVREIIQSIEKKTKKTSDQKEKLINLFNQRSTQKEEKKPNKQISDSKPDILEKGLTMKQSTTNNKKVVRPEILKNPKGENTDEMIAINPPLELNQNKSHNNRSNTGRLIDTSITKTVKKISSFNRRSDSYTLSIVTNNLLDNPEQESKKIGDPHIKRIRSDENLLKKHATLTNISKGESLTTHAVKGEHTNENKDVSQDSVIDTREEKKRNCPCLQKEENYRLEFFSKAVTTLIFVTCIKCQQSYHNRCVNLSYKEAELMMSHNIPYTCIVCLSESLGHIHTIKKQLNEIVGEPPQSEEGIEMSDLKVKDDEKCPLAQPLSCNNIKKSDDAILNNTKEPPVVIAENDKHIVPNKDDHNSIIDKLIATLATRNEFRRLLRVNSLSHRVKKNKENYMWDEFC